MRDDLSAVPGDPGPDTEARHGGDAPMRDEDTDALSGGRVADLASGAESEVE
ncbi:MAG: hypothetical protein H0U16_07735, partial [Actinobacteria bacterium]|nr:hypothetical protein [Actinomycetota bacterium]